MRVDDSGAIAMLANALTRERWGTEDVTEDEVRSWFRDDIDGFVADLDGTLLAYGDRWRSRDGKRLQLDLRVARPDAGTALLARLEDAPALADGAHAIAPASADDEPLRAVLEGAGYDVFAHSFRMAISLDDHEPSEMPEWVEVRPYRPEHEPGIHATHQEAFSDLAEHVSLSLGEWRTWFVDVPSFDPSLWFVAWVGDEVVGISLSQVSSSGDPAHGHVNVLAVRRPWRGRGLGAALLAQTFTAMKQRGMSRATLGVDADNTTGAVRLYERAGMRVERRYDIYRKELA